MTAEPISEEHYRRCVLPYYKRLGSRVGYTVLLGRTRHFGWYEPGQSAWGFAAAMRRMERLLAVKLALPAGSHIIDAGCGVGDTARTVALASGAAVTGIDGVATDIALARRRSAASPGAADRTRFLVGDYHHLPLPDASCHGLYTMETFVHSPAPARALAEFRRVLRPQGRLVMFEYSRTPSSQLTPAANEALRRVCVLSGMPAFLHTLTHGRTEELLEDAGFGVESDVDATERILPMLWAFSVLGRVPYGLARSVGRGDALVNAMSGVEMYRHQDAWRYHIYVAAKR